MTLEVTFTPADFEALPHQDLSNTACVVFDVLRATSTIVTALSKGALSVLPVGSIAEALKERAADPEVLLAGERNGLRITADVSGSVDFDLGNSPREFTSARVRDRRIVTTTTNGTRAFAACRGARHVLAGSFLNLQRTAQHLAQLRCKRVLLICSGTGKAVAFEDCLGTGALCRALKEAVPDYELTDSAQFATDVYTTHESDLLSGITKSSNARRLLANPALAGDIAFCLTPNLYPIVVVSDPHGRLYRADISA
jgi:2-phosphosulfolactate phosphatase